MRSLSELVLAQGQTVSAVGWLDGPTDDRVLCVSPSWRDDRRVRVQGGFVSVSPPPAEADALRSAPHEFVRVDGTWQDGAVADARIVEHLATNQPVSARSAAVVVQPTQQQQRVLSDLLKAGVVVWYRAVRRADGTRVLRVGTADPLATESMLTAKGLKGAHVVEVAWTAEDVEAARADLNRHAETWHIAATGGGGVAADADLPGFSAEVLYVESDFAAWADALPQGLLEATVLIQPERRQATGTNDAEN
ncbi:hypothetical protein ACQPYH_28135 [Kribbella sp. CA-245084]|uniref:hypothetical protein n=1 Tax=Kribbella sp. CA-245084 TaxID=3239940 RepID=UPI003D93414E